MDETNEQLPLRKQDTGNRQVLADLAQVVRDENESSVVRAVAYRAMPVIDHFDPDEYLSLGFKGIEEMAVDWAWVDRWIAH